MPRMASSTVLLCTSILLHDVLLVDVVVLVQPDLWWCVVLHDVPLVDVVGRTGGHLGTPVLRMTSMAGEQ